MGSSGSTKNLDVVSVREEPRERGAAMVTRIEEQRPGHFVQDQAGGGAAEFTQPWAKTPPPGRFFGLLFRADHVKARDLPVHFEVGPQHHAIVAARVAVARVELGSHHDFRRAG